MNISIDKIIVVLGFLAVLVAIQFIVKLRTRDRTNLDNHTSKIKLRSRLNLSNNERADLLNVDGKSLLIIFLKTQRMGLSNEANYYFQLIFDIWDPQLKFGDGARF